jgi:hypothetical protein
MEVVSKLKLKEGRNGRTGVTRGEPMNEIMDQSNVITLMPRPVSDPKTALTFTLFGAIQH